MALDPPSRCLAYLPRRKALRILLLEDDAETLATLELGLRLEGHAVTSACDAPSALMLVRRGDFDVAVLDVVVPQGSGLDVLAAIRAKARPARVLMLTARGETADRIEGPRPRRGRLSRQALRVR